MAEYQDSQPISNSLGYDPAEVPANVKPYSDNIRHKMYGKDVRESLARAVDIIGIEANKAFNGELKPDVAADVKKALETQEQNTKNLKVIVSAMHDYGVPLGWNGDDVIILDEGDE